MIEADAATIAGRITRADAVELMVAEMRSEVPAFEHLSEDSLADIVSGLDRTLRRWYGFLATGAMPAETDFEPLREWTRARAAEGFRLEDLLRSFGLLHQLGWRLLRTHARPGEAEALVELAGLLAQYVERVSTVVTETYLTERELLVSEEERRARSLLDHLAGDTRLTPAEHEIAQRLGVPLDRPLSPFAVSIPGSRPHRHAALAARLRRRGLGLAVTQSDCVVGLTWTALEVADLEEGPGVLLAIGEPAPRRKLPAAREELAVLVEHARGIGAAGRVRVEDNLLEILLAGSPGLTARLRERVLAPLEDDAHADLARTLRTLFACRLDRKATSEALHIHRNTLAYRLARVEELTGLDLGSPRDLVCLYAALQSPSAAREPGPRA
jgi:hypothetical protein